MRNTMSIWGYFSTYSSHRLEHFCAHTWMHPEYHTQTSHHITSCRWKHWATGSLSESGGRRRPAMTAGGFSQHLTGGGEPSHLIDYRQDLCAQDCRCGLQDAALIWWRTLSASLLLTFFFLIHLSSIPLASFPFSLFHPVPLLLSSFHSANHSFLLSPSPLLLSSSSTYFTTRDLSQAFKTDGWWWMVRQTRSLSPSLSFPSPLSSFLLHGLDFVFFDALSKLMRICLREGDDVLSNDRGQKLLPWPSNINKRKASWTQDWKKEKGERRTTSIKNSVKDPLKPMRIVADLLELVPF